MGINWLDVITVLILILFGYMGYKRGAARSLANLCGTVLSSIGSVFVGSVVAKSIYTTFFKASIIDKISLILFDKGTEAADATLSRIFGALPEYVQGALTNFGYSIEDVRNAINMDNARTAAETIEPMVAPIITTFISVIAIIIMFIVLRVVLNFLVKLIEKVLSMFMLKFVNSAAGSVIGVVEGIILVVVLAVVLRIATSIVTDMPAILSADSVQSSLLFKYLYNFDFLYDIQNLFV